MNDLTGQKFGRLTVLYDSEDRDGVSRRVIWLCKCDCGNLKRVKGNDLKTGNTKSCGCLNREMSRKRMFKHGDRYTRLYQIWTEMKRRCHAKKRECYKYYGGRGIRVCNEWKNSYPTFKFWAILNGYKDNLTIDRINNDGNYKPGNCQWLTNSENARKAQLQRQLKK